MRIKTTKALGGRRRKQMRILLCDNEKLILAMISRILRSADYDVVTVASPTEGIAVFRKSSFAAVITDVLMEPVDGFAFRDMLRACNKTVPIVFLTSLIGGSENKLLTMIARDPCSYFLPKQSDRQLILNKLDQILMAYRAERAQEYARTRMHEELALASSIQQAMLPPYVYSGPFFEYSCLYRPLHKISGDLYERLPISESSGVFVFGDLSGHGIHSALAMIAVQSFLKNVNPAQENLPCTLARELNGFLWRQLHGLVYMCALIVYYDFERNFLQCYNSGMNNLLRINSVSGEITRLNPENKGSMPLGIMAETNFSREDTVEMHFDDDDCFVAASDGLSDLSQDPAGHGGMDMDFFHELLAQAILQSRELGDIVSIPFQFYSMLELAGYTCPQDDALLLVMRKKTGPEPEVLFAGCIRCLHDEIDQLVQQVSERVSRRYAPCIELAVSVELLLQEHLTNVVRHGFASKDYDGEYLFVKITGGERTLKVVVWDRGREWRDHDPGTADPDACLEMLNVHGASGGRGVPIIQKIASRISRKRWAGLNECTFIIPTAIGEEIV